MHSVSFEQVLWDEWFEVYFPLRHCVTRDTVVVGFVYVSFQMKWLPLTFMTEAFQTPCPFIEFVKLRSVNSTKF